MSLADFYDFPFHPLVLKHSSYLLYCKLADQRTKCYQTECGDLVCLFFKAEISSLVSGYGLLPGQFHLQLQEISILRGEALPGRRRTHHLPQM